MRRQERILYSLLIVTLFMISCDVSTLVATPQNTALGPNAVNEIIARTAAAAATQTAKLFTVTFTPSITPLPTFTPSETPTYTATPFLFILLSPTRPTQTPPLIITPATPITPSAKDYDCQVTGQSPANDSSVAANQVFQMNWTVANTGRLSWASTSVDFVYQGGTRLYKGKGVDLPKTVAAGEVISLKISMTAPKGSGSYKTTWDLQTGQNVFCTMSVRIKVP